VLSARDGAWGAGGMEGGAGAALRAPHPDVSRLLQAPARRRSSCDSRPTCCRRCTARIARSAAEATRPRCGNPAPACACCVSPQGPGMRKWARLRLPERTEPEY
jgi:hypothetical protein